ncbi:MAG TPA: hypothetical protein VN924_29705 [Bryobacteraceae bacterium]|nr:hypothetical protein [Bryobacteraceae bacterium]
MRTLVLSLRPIFATAAIAIATCAVSTAQYKFVPLSVPGSTLTFPEGISNENLIVGQYANSTGETYGFSYNPANGAWTDPIKSRGNTTVVANAANSAGTIVGYYQTSTATYGMIDTGGVLSEFNESGCSNTVIAGINDYESGTMTGFCSLANGDQEGWIGSPWNTVFKCFNATHTMPVAINNWGIVGGNYWTGSGLNITANGFLSTAFGACSLIAYPGAAYTSVGGLNDNGAISGSYSFGDTWNGFVYNDTYSTVNAPNAVTTVLSQINNNDWLVGMYVDAEGASHGFCAEPIAGESMLAERVH